jgi:FkbM family methyltransferase
VYFLGAHEKNNLFLVRDLLREHQAPVFADIGANVGEFSLFMSRYAGQVHSFEPWPVVRAALNDKVDRNNLTNVHVHPVGLGERNEMLTYYAPQGANTATGSFSADHATDRNRPSEQLEIANGDEYFEAQGIKKVDVIKMDVEGWEGSVLRGLKKTLERSRPTIFLEFSTTTLSRVGDLNGFLATLPPDYQASYVTYTRRGAVPQYSPFDATRIGDVLLRPR